MAFSLAVKVLVAFAFMVFGAVAQAQQQQVNLGTDEYIRENRKQYDNVIADYNREIATFKLNYEQRVTAVDVQNAQLAETLAQTNSRLDPLEILNATTKFCVRKYRYPTKNIGLLQTALLACASTSLAYSATLIKPLESTKQVLDSYYKNNLNAYLNDCTKKFSTQPDNYTLCVTQAIANTNAYTNNNQKTFNTQLEQAQCSADGGIRKALDCSYFNMQSAIESNGKAVALIDNCIAEVTECKPCNATRSFDESCENVLNISMQESDYRSATIANPFYGLDKNVPCILFNFNKALALPPAKSVN